MNFFTAWNVLMTTDFSPAATPFQLVNKDNAQLSNNGLRTHKKLNGFRKDSSFFLPSEVSFVGESLSSDENQPSTCQPTAALAIRSENRPSSSSTVNSWLVKIASHQTSSSNDSVDQAYHSETATNISVHETYQLGYCNHISGGEPCDNLYIFDFVDGLEVSYPVTVTGLDSLPLDIPPLFLEPGYVDQLAVIASTALNQLAVLLNNWFRSCEHAEERILALRHMDAHKEAVELRRLTIELLTSLVPHSSLCQDVDLESPRTDRFIAHISSIVARDIFSNVTESGCRRSSQLSVPLVSLCPDPEHCLSLLRDLVVGLLKKLLPGLELPPSFESTRDLQPLLTHICELNRTGTG